MNAAQRKLLTDQIRGAIKSSELSQLEIGRRAEIDKSSLSKFVNGERGLSLGATERLVEVLGLHVVAKRK